MSVAPGVAHARPGPAVSSIRRRLVIGTIGLLALGLAAVAVVVLASEPSSRAARTAFNAATPYRCGHATPPAGIDCWQGTNGTLVDLKIQYSNLGARQVVASIATGAGVVGVLVEPAPAVFCVSPGEPVVIRRSGGAVATLFTPEGTLATSNNPNIDQGTALQGGVALLATALLIPAALGLAEMRRRRRGANPEVVEAYRPRVMRWALLAFLLGQAADVVTSAIGQASGLNEGNALVDAFIRATGPVGFVLFRLPAIVLVLLVLSQVPRRIAAATLVGLGAVFVAVGVHNAVLAAGAGAGVVCGGTIALP